MMWVLFSCALIYLDGQLDFGIVEADSPESDTRWPSL